MEAAAVCLVALIVLALREHQHERAIQRQAELHAKVIDDLASRVVRPLAPIPRQIVRDENTEPPKRGEGHLVGVVKPVDGPPDEE